MFYVRGYHIYKEIWYATVGEVLVCEREPNNFQDKYTIAVKKKENSARLIFAHKATRKNILTVKITQTTVHKSSMSMKLASNVFWQSKVHLHSHKDYV